MIDRKVLSRLADQHSEIETARNGEYTLHLNGKYIHSKFEPSKEAQRLVEQIIDLDPQETLVIFLGAGLGYHIELLEKQGFHNIIAIELDSQVFSLFEQIYLTSGLQCVIGPQQTIEKLDSFFTLLPIEKFKNIKTVKLRGGYDQAIYAPVEERIKRLVRVKLGDFTTRLKFEEIWFINILRNIPNLRRSFTVAGLFGAGKSFPILLVSAGPSLKYSLPALKSIAPYVFILAVDTALLPLFEAGIVPDAVYSLDSQVYSLADFSMIDLDYLARTTLIYDIVVNCALSANFPGRQVVANTAHIDHDINGHPYIIKNELVNWLELTGNLSIGDVETGGSVATSAFHLAFLMGGDPIILVGQDLAYTFKMSHASSTPHFYRLCQLSNRILPIDTIFMSILDQRKVFSVPGITQEVLTDFSLNNYRGWFEVSSANIKKTIPEFSLINSSYSGAKIDHFSQIPLEHLEKQLNKNGMLQKEKIFNQLNLIDSFKIDKIIANLNKMKDFALSLKVEESLFEQIESSDYAFLGRLFMREKVIYERYGNFEKFHIGRKLSRLLKNLEKIVYVV